MGLSVDEIVAAHEAYGGNASEAARHLPYSEGTIVRHWREEGFRVMSIGEQARLTEEEIGEITAAHAIYNGNAFLAAKKLHHGHSTITKYWREAGLPIRKTGQHGDVNLKDRMK